MIFQTGIELCYNAPKRRQLAWLQGAYALTDPIFDGTWIGSLVGVASYGERRDGVDNVVLKVKIATDMTTTCYSITKDA